MINEHQVTEQYLEFNIGVANCLINCKYVQEILRLPALVNTNSKSSYKAGIMDLRGKALEVLDGRLLFEQEQEQYKLSDKVIVIGEEKAEYGLIVQSLKHVRIVSKSQIEDTESSATLVNKLVHTPEGLLSILDYKILTSLVSEEIKSSKTCLPFYKCLKKEEEEQFKERSKALMGVATNEQGSERKAYAVIELGEEFYGIPLHTITEFLEVDSITPVPCCPEHIIGNTNRRGDVLTIMDVSKAFDVERKGKADKQKVVVIGEKRDTVGVVVDEVYDVCHLETSQILPPPNSLCGVSDGYLTGVVHNDKRLLGILCVKTLLSNERWRVSEVV